MAIFPLLLVHGKNLVLNFQNVSEFSHEVDSYFLSTLYAGLNGTFLNGKYFFIFIFSLSLLIMRKYWKKAIFSNST